MQRTYNTDLLNSLQKQLYTALLERESSWAEMYYGAIYVLNQHENPERYSQAAFSLRELLNDIMGKTKGSLIEKIKGLGNAWVSVKRNSSCCNDGIWVGEICDHIRSFFSKVEEFFIWENQQLPSIKERIKLKLRSLDEAGRPLPESIEEKNIDDYRKLFNYFQGIAHHNTIPNEDEFAEKRLGLEQFLFERLVPQVYKSIAVIEKLIGEGEFDE